MKLIKNYVKNKYNLYDLDELNELIEQQKSDTQRNIKLLKETYEEKIEKIKQQYETKLKCNEEFSKEILKKKNEEIKNELSKLLKEAIFANKEGKFNYSYVYNDLKSKLNEIIDKLNEN